MKDLFEAWRNRNRLAVIGFTESSVSILNLRKRRRGVQCGEIVGLDQTFDFMQPDAGFLASLIARFNLAHTPLVLSLPGRYCRHKLIKLPEAYTGWPSDWLEKNLSNVLPPGVAADRVNYGFQIMSGGSAAEALFLTFGRKEMMDAWSDVLSTLHLQVLALRADPVSILQACAFLDTNFHSQNWLFLHWQGGSNSMMLSQQGQLRAYQELSYNGSDAAHTESVKGLKVPRWHAAISCELSQLGLQDAIHKVVVFGEKIGDCDLELLDEFGPVVSADQILTHLIPKEPLHGRASLFGLGVNQLYSPDETADLLSGPYLEQVRDKISQVQAVNVAVVAAVVLVGLWLAILTGQLFVNRELNFWNTEVAKLQAQITHIEDLKENGVRLSQELELSREIRGRQSLLARTLWELAGKMPKNIWLRELRYGMPEAKPGTDSPSTHFILKGLALDEDSPTRLLANLERMPEFTGAQIELLELIPVEDVLKHTRRYNRPLIRFKLCASYRT